MNSQNQSRQGRAAGSSAAHTSGTVILCGGETDSSGEPVVLLRPGEARVVGPGRRERGYQRRIAGLESEREAAGRARDTLQAEMEVALLVERGAHRLLDRLERSLEQEKVELGEVRSQGHRLMVALGALQRENRALRSALQQERARVLGPPRRTSRGGLLGRLWGGRRRATP